MKPIFFFVWKLVSRASLPRGPFFKMSLLLSYKSTSFRKKHHFLGFFRVIELFIRFLRLQGRILKKGPRSRPALVISFQTKKNCIYNEGLWRIFGDKMTYFWPLFCSYLRQMSGYRAENFTIASSLQYQHMLQISAQLYVPGLRSIFEVGEALNYSLLMVLLSTRTCRWSTFKYFSPAVKNLLVLWSGDPVLFITFVKRWSTLKYFRQDMKYFLLLRGGWGWGCGKYFVRGGGPLKLC